MPMQIPSEGDSMIKDYLRNTLQEFKNYPLSKDNCRYHLNANESPFNLSEIEPIRSRISEALRQCGTNDYPDPNCTELRKAIAQHFSITSEQILVGNGCDEVISIICNTFLNEGDSVVVHQPTFEMYGIYSKMLGARVVSVQDKGQNVIAVEELIRAANEEKAKLLFLCRPNNPTGYLLPYEEVEKILAQTRCLVVVDEAYIDFAKNARSLVELLDRQERLIVLRTFSKAFALAGLRVGYAMASREIIEALNLVRSPYNVNSLSQKFACIALEHYDLLATFTTLLQSERDRIYEEILQIPFLRGQPSDTNFFFIEVTSDEAYDRIQQSLSDKSIKVRTYPKEGPYKNYIRVSISTPEINDMLLSALRGD